MRKEKVLEAINSFPAEFELEELMEKLIFIEKVEKGLAQLDQGDGMAQEEVKKAVSNWPIFSTEARQEDRKSSRKAGLAKGLIKMREGFDGTSI